MFEREGYTADQGSLAAFVGQLAEDFDSTYFLENMKKGDSPARFWSILGEGGYLGILAPEEYGGAGSRPEDLVVFLHNMARNGLASHRLMNQLLCCDLLSRYGSDEQKREHIPAIVSGSLYCPAIMEETEGLDLFDFEMKAVARGESFLLSGTKRYVPGACDAERWIVAARTAETGVDEREQGISLFMVSPQSPGIEMIPRELNVRVTAEEEMMLITGDAFFDVVFEDVEVSRADLIGPENSAAEAIATSANLLFLMTAVTAIGWGENVLEKAVEYAGNRTIFEEPIGAYQAIQHRLVRARTELELAKLAIARAVGSYANNEADVGVYSSIAKCAASEAAYQACDISLQTHGGYGFDRETGIITLWPLILLSRILPLNNEVILEDFAEAALDLPARSN